MIDCTQNIEPRTGKMHWESLIIGLYFNSIKCAFVTQIIKQIGSSISKASMSMINYPCMFFFNCSCEECLTKSNFITITQCTHI